MSYIQIIDEEGARGLLSRLYQTTKARAGYVAQVIQIMSQDPEMARASIQLYLCLMKSERALSRVRKEMLATVVSNVNDCYY